MAESHEPAAGDTTESSQALAMPRPSLEESDELTPEELEEFKGLTPEEIDRELSDRPSENPSVDRCIRACNRAIRKEKPTPDDDEDDIHDNLMSAAKSAFLRNMPPLDSFENVRDFIACVTFAEVANIIEHYEAENLLSSAKVALAAVRHERKPRQSEPKRLGRPPKSASAEEKK
jgi:hypothetical protein